mmetsp:Transcript_123656/g.238545  ORF Transcript_123656/g.238545 Transcript_123656/m.238545 type:complete len:209 (-) Transcript_123656:230-856(-)
MEERPHASGRASLMKSGRFFRGMSESATCMYHPCELGPHGTFRGTMAAFHWADFPAWAHVLSGEVGLHICRMPANLVDCGCEEELAICHSPEVEGARVLCPNRVGSNTNLSFCAMGGSPGGEGTTTNLSCDVEPWPVVFNSTPGAPSFDIISNTPCPTPRNCARREHTEGTSHSSSCPSLRVAGIFKFTSHWYADTESTDDATSLSDP